MEKVFLLLFLQKKKNPSCLAYFFFDFRAAYRASRAAFCSAAI